MLKSIRWTAVAALVTSGFLAGGPVLPVEASTTTPTGIYAPTSVAEYTRVLTEAIAHRPAPTALSPSLANAPTAFNEAYHDKCYVEVAETQFPECAYGDPQGKYTVWLIGDSHAVQWFPAMQAVAVRHHIRLVVHAKSACPLLDVPINNPSNWKLPYPECSAWQAKVMQAVTAAKPDLIITTGTVAVLDKFMDSFGRRLKQLGDTGAKVVVLGDTPRLNEKAPACVAAHLSDVAACAVKRGSVPYAAARTTMQSTALASGAMFTQTMDWLCTQASCPSVIGNILAYRDATHITASVSSWLRNRLDIYLSPMLPKMSSITSVTVTPMPAASHGPLAVTVVSTSPLLGCSVFATVPGVGKEMPVNGAVVDAPSSYPGNTVLQYSAFPLNTGRYQVGVRCAGETVARSAPIIVK
jgi:hypothetical protein